MALGLISVSYRQDASSLPKGSHTRINTLRRSLIFLALKCGETLPLFSCCDSDHSCCGRDGRWVLCWKAAPPELVAGRWNRPYRSEDHENNTSNDTILSFDKLAAVRGEDMEHRAPLQLRTREKRSPYLAGDLLGRCSVQCARKATLQNLPGRLIKIYGEQGIALESSKSSYRCSIHGAVFKRS
jgi:hypothetical protein